MSSATSHHHEPGVISDFGDDLLYAAESVHQEALAVIRNLDRAREYERRKAHKYLCDARALINEAITECQP